ncbi:uncharacterized protein YndB with AHSA1/START domain [Microbacterium telephonicum]|uniref:Uncharacterized protein YndB with AHSA1/START domain n=1 Tax=Microbacterium telephonicum TaxID=1714841 RepID=A0A498C3U3_9MICO|nr:uncharacterized protein YndB with AHSA1/START domain [Microbacterium telephonicum]
MTEPFTRSLIGTATHPEIVIERRYDASPSAVWDALTTPARLGRWLGTVTGEPRAVGDRFGVAFPDAPADAAAGTVVRCEAPHRIVVAWEWGTEAPSTVTVAIRVDGDGSRVVLAHRLAEPPHVADYGGGWEDCLQRLASLHGGTTAHAVGGETPRWHDMQTQALDLGVRLPAAPADVWRALTTEAGLRRWWWDHWDDVEITVDARTDGAYRYAAPGAGIRVRPVPRRRRRPAAGIHVALGGCGRRLAGRGVRAEPASGWRRHPPDTASHRTLARWGAGGELPPGVGVHPRPPHRRPALNGRGSTHAS